MRCSHPHCHKKSSTHYRVGFGDEDPSDPDKIIEKIVSKGRLCSKHFKDGFKLKKWIIKRAKEVK